MKSTLQIKRFKERKYIWCINLGLLIQDKNLKRGQKNAKN